MAGTPPRMRPMAVPPNPTTSETREPKSSRLKMSRLRSSVPRRCPHPGEPFWGAEKFWKSGLGRGSRLAKMATMMISPIQPAQIQKKAPNFFLADRAGWPDSSSRPAGSAAADAARAAATLPGRISGERGTVWREISVTGDPRVDDGEDEVKDEVDQHDGHGDDEGDPLDDGVVVLVDGRDDLEA